MYAWAARWTASTTSPRLVAEDPTRRPRALRLRQRAAARRAATRTPWSELRAYLDLAEDEGNAWGRLAEALARLGRVDEAADAYLTGIDQSLKHGHTGMADEFRAALEAL